MGASEPGTSAVGAVEAAAAVESGAVPIRGTWRPMEPALAAAALAPLAVALAAAFFQPLRPAALVIAVAGTLVAGGRRSPAVWPWAATIPLAAILTWGLIPAPAALAGLASCASLLSPPMLWRVTELAVVLGVIAVLVRWLGSVPRHIPRDRVDSGLLVLTGAASVAIVPLALLMGADASRAFFGDRDFETGLAGALVPGLIFAFANATLEETIYRGVLLGWLEPALGTTGAILAQAAVFGLAHNGTDYVASPLPVIAAMFATGAIAGFIVKRTGSLVIPIVIHAAFDVPLYYGLACRIG